MGRPTINRQLRRAAAAAAGRDLHLNIMVNELAMISMVCLNDGGSRSSARAKPIRCVLSHLLQPVEVVQ